jgi:hypothetical protein
VESLFFAIKTLLVTFLVVLLMQVKWGSQTVEQIAYQSITTSSLVVPLEEAADGAVVFMRNSWRKVTQSINTNFTNSLRSENQPGQRHLEWGKNRSQAYIEQTKKNISGTVNAARNDYGPAAVEAYEEASSNTAGIIERFKKKVSQVGQNVKGKFIDETQVPTETQSHRSPQSKRSTDNTSAKSTEDDDIIEE